MAYALETWIKGQEVLQGWPKADGEVYLALDDIAERYLADHPDEDTWLTQFFRHALARSGR